MRLAKRMFAFSLKGHFREYVQCIIILPSLVNGLPPCPLLSGTGRGHSGGQLSLLMPD